jgi:signal transduction histidine kinase
MSWQQTSIQAAASYLRESIGKGNSDARAKVVYEGLLAGIAAERVVLLVVNSDLEIRSQVVTSLLGRAVDYSPPAAAILVSARADNGDVQVSVTDRGRAVASDLEAQLLGHGGSSVSHAQIRVLATNVGLPMARQIVEMHGGRIWYEVGAGTVWSFTIPVAARAATPQFDAGRRVLSP